MALQQFIVTYLLSFLKYVIINKSSLDLTFKFKLYKSTLNKKAKKDNKQFGDLFVKNMEKS